jgi:hypothetical protein
MPTLLNRLSSNTVEAVSLPSLLTVVGPKISTTTFARRVSQDEEQGDENLTACHQMHNMSDEILYRWNQSTSVNG